MVVQRKFKQLPEESFAQRALKGDSAFNISICYLNDSNVIWQIWMLIAKDYYKSSVVAKSKKYDKEKALLNYKIGVSCFYLQEYRQANTWLNSAIKKKHNKDLQYYFLAYTNYKLKKYEDALDWIIMYIETQNEPYKSVEIFDVFYYGFHGCLFLFLLLSDLLITQM